MIKGLEALNDLRTFTKCVKTNTPFPKVITEEQCYDTIEKELKALEIIRREPSMVCWQALSEDYEDYLDNTPEEQRYIKSKEEFDLLKEVLL